MVPESGLAAAQIYSGSGKTLETDKKRVAILFFVVVEWSRALLRGVRGSARAGIRVPDEGDALDDLLPRGLEPRVLVRLGGLSHSD